MNGKQTLYLDQHGCRYWASTVKQLRKQIANGGSRVTKMYRDKKDGSTAHVGYVIGDRWLSAYRQVEN